MYKPSTYQSRFSRPIQQWGLAMILLATFFMLDLIVALPANAAPNAVTWPPITLRQIADGFDGPVNVIGANDGTDRLFVVEKGGFIYIIENGVRVAEPFLDISDRVAICHECGLLGLAFPPTYATDGYFFVNYTSNTDLIAPDTGDINPNIPNFGDTVIARFQVTGDPNVADSTSEEQILVVNQPDDNHNGGHILFGPDAYLYIGMGDGGGSGDTHQNGQDPQSLHGKILRLEVGATGTYTIPASNPFTNTTPYRDEIWATGVRNPWRFHFDRVTGDLYVADVGQGNIEEVSHVAAAEIGNGGMNFGWKIMEGDRCYPPNGSQSCDRAGLTIPVTTYTHELGDCSVTGGYVYAPPIANQEPIYLYGDFCTGRMWGLQPDGDDWATTLLEDFPFQITTFGEDALGNVYLVDYSGTLYQLDDTITEVSASNDGPAEVGDTISFRSVVTGGSEVAYTWDFGDGNVGVGITATHSYAQSGLYTATLTASNATNSISATTTVYVGDAVVEVLGNNVFAPENVTVPQGGVVVWVLRGGNHSVTADDGSFEQPAGDDWPPFIQTFNTQGTISYHCTVHGGTGGAGMSGTVTVDAPPPPITGLSATNDSPHLVNESVTLSATVTGGTAISYSWDFGDGNLGSGITTTHTYTPSGVYTATVTATNFTNSISTTTTVYVGDAIVAVRNNAFVPSEVTVAPGEKVIWVLEEGNHSVTADDGSFEQPAGTNWPPFIQAFEASALNTASTLATYGYYCSVHGGPGGVGMSGTVIVDESVPTVDPVAGLTASNNGPATTGAPINFTAAITAGTEVSYTWDFGDPYNGSAGSGITATHTYTESGIYTATVTAANATNSLSATTTIYIGDAVVEVTNNAFTPRNVTVPVGGKVVWVLREGHHSVTADDGSFEQPVGNDWSPFMHTFTQNSVNPYYCSAHGAPGGNGMAGSVTVGSGEPPVEDAELLLPTIRNGEE